MMTVSISTAQYERAHGRKPRGRGSWAFFFDGDESIDSAFWVSGMYVEARRQAIQEARRLGKHTVEVGS